MKRLISTAANISSQTLNRFDMSRPCHFAINLLSYAIPAFKHFLCQVDRSLLRLHIGLANVLPHNAHTHQLNTAQEADDGHKRGITTHRIAQHDGLHYDPQSEY